MKRTKAQSKNNLPKGERRTQAYTTYLMFVKALREKALSVKESLKDLDVCLHYQLIQQ
jgi:thermostable 8-oxoguanine DNA glycosylase